MHSPSLLCRMVSPRRSDQTSLEALPEGLLSNSGGRRIEHVCSSPQKDRKILVDYLSGILLAYLFDVCKIWLWVVVQDFFCGFGRAFMDFSGPRRFYTLDAMHMLKGK